MMESPQPEMPPLVIWVEHTFRIIGRAEVAFGIILQGLARLGMTVEVWQKGQRWQARIEGVERIRLAPEAREERKQGGLPTPLGFILQPQEPQIEPGALILGPGAMKDEPRWAEVMSLEEAQKLASPTPSPTRPTTPG